MDTRRTPQLIFRVHPPAAARAQQGERVRRIGVLT
jgi:hypothetical protein